jgi:hypothetical protein
MSEFSPLSARKSGHGVLILLKGAGRRGHISHRQSVLPVFAALADLPRRRGRYRNPPRIGWTGHKMENDLAAPSIAARADR